MNSADGTIHFNSSFFAIADYLHISETSTLKLLEALGGECAGLISFLSEDEDDLVSKETSYKLDSTPSSVRFLPGIWYHEYIKISE